MLYIETESKDAAFHFSVEEYFTRLAPVDAPVMMIWQTGNCVMLGGYQVAAAEIDLNYAQKEGIQIVRRSSGGGTIFTDSGTLLYTMITPLPKTRYPQQTAKELFAESVTSALNAMGLAVKAEGRNDITIDGKKVSGMAQYVRGGRVCSHCSLLYDTSLETLTRVLQVDEEKIHSKAIRSVRARVANLKDYMEVPLSTRDFLTAFKRALFEQVLLRGKDISNYTLSSHERAEIDTIYREKYANPSWTFGASPEYSFHTSKRFAGGKVEVFLSVKNGAIASCSIRGDFLGTIPIRGLEERLEKKEFHYKALDDALGETELFPYLGDVTKEQLLSCMFLFD